MAKLPRGRRKAGGAKKESAPKKPVELAAATCPFCKFPDGMTAKDVGRVLGISRQAVSQRKGMPRNAVRPGEDAATYDLRQVHAWEVGRAMEAAAKVAMGGDDNAEASAALRKKEAEASKLEAQLGEYLGVLVRVDEVERRVSELTTTLVQELHRLPSIAAQRLYGREPEEIERVLHEQIDGATERMIAGLRKQRKGGRI